MTPPDARPNPAAPGFGCTCLVILILCAILAFTFIIKSLPLEGDDDEGAGAPRTVHAWALDGTDMRELT